MPLNVSFFYCLILSILHFTSKYITFIKDSPRSKFLSLAGGIAVSYVFVDLLPQVTKQQKVMEDATNEIGLKALENHAFVVSLIGLVFFYGLQALVRKSKNKGEMVKKKVFWIHITSFSIYNALVGYLLIREQYKNLWGMFFYFAALAVHFIINDHSLRSHHPEVYDRYGRWIVSVAILIGWIIGYVTKVNELVISLLLALLAGGMVLNVLKEELPKEKEGSFGAFTIGVIAYTILLFCNFLFSN